jgi:uncharacterized protein involved in exopolysaccharide biosynthesis
VQVVDRAVVPDRKSWPKPTIILPAAAFLGMFLGVVWAFAAEGMRRIASNPAERLRLDTLQRLMSSRR